MPDGPAPTPVLSRITTSAPDPEPAASSPFARCQAVERPCTPAPTTTYFACSGSATVVARLVVVGPRGAHAEEGAVRIGHRGPSDRAAVGVVGHPSHRCAQFDQTLDLGVDRVDRHLDRRGHRAGAPSRSTE